MDQIETRMLELDELLGRFDVQSMGVRLALPQPTNPLKQSEPIENKSPLFQVMMLISEIWNDIDYFSLLIMNHEINDKWLIKYYLPRVDKALALVQHVINLLGKKLDELSNHERVEQVIRELALTKGTH